MNVTHDGKLLIAIGRSRTAKQWQNREMLWSAFLDKLAATTRTREAVVEYVALSKTDRDNIKDVGGFVGGYLKNGRRNNASVVNRCLVCLDIDHADPELFSDLDVSFINAFALYATHSHTPAHMRLRLIIPLNRARQSSRRRSRPTPRPPKGGLGPSGPFRGDRAPLSREFSQNSGDGI